MPPIPTPLDELRQRRFSFYPPIVNIEHNEWMVRRATWNEVQVVNTKSSNELWVPLRFLGEVSLIDEPVVIVGLLKELEYQAGAVLPHVRRVIEMPRAVNDSFRFRMRAPESERPAPVIGIRVESGVESRAGRMVRVAFAAGILACVAVAIVLRDGTMGSRVRLSAESQIHLPLAASDDYDSIVSKFGPPGRDGWSRTGDWQYRRMWYPQRSFTLVLAGRDRDHAYYIGAVDPYGRVIHSVELPGGRNSAAMLTRLR